MDPATAERAARLLLRYDIIIIDEAHERTVNTDLLLGTLKSVQAERKEWLRRIDMAKKQQKGIMNGRTANGNGAKPANGLVKAGGDDLGTSDTEESDNDNSSSEGGSSESSDPQDVLDINWGPYEMRELKIIIMSATLNADKFRAYLDE